MTDRVHDSLYTEADYRALAEALGETDQGRWFLAEHARRGGDVDTFRLLSSIERLQRVAEEHTSGDAFRGSRELEDMSAALAQMTFDVIGAPDPADRRSPYGRIGQDAERASDLVAASGDRIANIATALAQRGDAHVAEALRGEVDVIREALAVHEANARRIVALAEILVYARRRLDALAAGPEPDWLTA